ncbi:MAG: hypothetical protein WC356_00285 [Candidatus Micrarchaeia archaeon]|jgi:hypothetical protein
MKFSEIFTKEIGRLPFDKSKTIKPRDFITATLLVETLISMACEGHYVDTEKKFIAYKEGTAVVDIAYDISLVEDECDMPRDYVYYAGYDSAGILLVYNKKTSYYATEPTEVDSSWLCFYADL